jgi:transposase
VHVKSPGAQKARALLAARKLLQTKASDVELSIRGLLRGFGLKMGEVSQGQFAARVEELVSGHAMLQPVLVGVLQARQALRRGFAALHRRVLAIVRQDAVCRRVLITAPGAILEPPAFSRRTRRAQGRCDSGGKPSCGTGGKKRDRDDPNHLCDRRRPRRARLSY